MRTKDITPGEEYAIAFSGTAFDRDRPRRAVVLETGATRRVHSRERWDFTGHDVRDGVRVEWLDGHRWRGDVEEVVAPARVVRPWAEHAAVLAAREAREAAQAEAAERLASRVRIVEVELALDATLRRGGPDAPTVEVSLAALEGVAARLRELWAGPGERVS